MTRDASLLSLVDKYTRRFRWDECMLQRLTGNC